MFLKTTSWGIPIVLLGLVSYGFTLDENDECLNPNEESGWCIPLNECQPLMLIYNQPVIAINDSTFIENSRCGTADGVTLVCCVEDCEDNTSELSVGNLPTPNECEIDLGNRIFGGEKTVLNEFPWSALIQYSMPQGNGYNCGGSLINSRYVVTAAHCIIGIPHSWKIIGVRLGEYDLSNDVDCDKNGYCNDPPVDMSIENITVHEDFIGVTNNFWHDIALIRFTSDVQFSNYIKPIFLPISARKRSREVVRGMKATAAGWGRTEYAHASDVKLKVKLPIVDPKKCGETYKKSKIQLNDAQLCAGGVSGKNTCSGDSGGPLMLLVRNNFILYGIVSFGPRECDEGHLPGVYTKVAKYVDWINDKVY